MKLKSDIKRVILYKEMFQYLKRNIDSDVVPEAKYKLHMNTEREFRADFLCPNAKIAIEINGGQHINGRHNRGGKGYETDLTKLNIAAANGYKVFQFTYEMLERNEHIKLLNNL